MKIIKPITEDIDKISEILSQWTEEDEVNKYISRIIDEINGKAEYGMHFWVIKDHNYVVGIAGLSDILPKIKEFTRTDNPTEIKIFYLNRNQRGKGYGKIFLDFLENKAGEQGKKEILIRSATLYRDTAWGFYEKFGYEKCGTVDDEMAVFRKLIVQNNLFA